MMTKILDPFIKLFRKSFKAFNNNFPNERTGNFLLLLNTQVRPYPGNNGRNHDAEDKHGPSPFDQTFLIITYFPL